MINYFSTVIVSGEQARTFLQGQLTCDMQVLESGQAILGACCDHKGRIIANFWVGQWQQDFYLCLPNAMTSLTIAQLKKYAVFSKVIIAECTDWTSLVYQGSQLPKVTITPLIQASITEQQNPDKNLHWLIGPKSSIQIAQPISDNHLTLILIEKKIVFIEPATSNKYLPQMIDWEKLGGVSFEKGCYVGQEVVARTQHLGKLKRHLHPLTISTTTQIPKIGNSLLNLSGEQVGNIVSIAPISENKCRLLAVIQDRAINEKILFNDVGLEFH